MEIGNSVSVKSGLIAQINDYLMSLHDVSEASKQNYRSCLISFVQYLQKQGIECFEKVTKTEIGQLLSTRRTQNTKNLYIFAIKSFYKNYQGAQQKDGWGETIG